jgi:transcriptional regulator GlxA family with amidase domain
MAVNVDGSVNDMDNLDTVFVCSGLNANKHVPTALIQKLRRLATHGTAMGAICTGSEVLAQAGLLDGYSSTIHWENMPAFIEDYPELEVVPELYEVDRNRYTCAGGTAALDMSLKLIALQCGSAIASAVSDQLIHHRMREGDEGQRMQLRTRYLLRQTSLPILSVALACGFVSASHFSKCYREHFSQTPSEERRLET